jgi:bacteriocin biosynthesis cyclodehydratase domain-containing protein
MISHPRLKPYLTAFPLDSTTWVIRGGSEELWRLRFAGEQNAAAFAALLTHLSGEYDVDTIRERLRSQGLSAQVIDAALRGLEDRALLEEAGDVQLSREHQEEFHDQLTFFSRFASDGGTHSQARLLESTVVLTGCAALSHAIGRQCRESGLQRVVELVDEGPDPGSEAVAARVSRVRSVLEETVGSQDRPACLVVAQETHVSGFCEALDELATQHQVPWLLVRAVDAHEGWVGPLFIPGETASYKSLLARLRGNVANYAEHEAFEKYCVNNRPATAGQLRPFLQLLAGMAVVELIKFITGFGSTTLAGRFITVGIMTWETETHHVLRVPGIDTAGFHTRPQPFAWNEIVFGNADIDRRRA